jgi:hypothetical protein
MPKLYYNNIEKNFRFSFVNKLVFNPKWDKKKKPKKRFSAYDYQPFVGVNDLEVEPIVRVTDLADVEEKWKKLGF